MLLYLGFLELSYVIHGCGFSPRGNMRSYNPWHEVSYSVTYMYLYTDVLASVCIWNTMDVCFLRDLHISAYCADGDDEIISPRIIWHILGRFLCAWLPAFWLGVQSYYLELLGWSYRCDTNIADNGSSVSMSETETKLIRNSDIYFHSHSRNARPCFAYCHSTLVCIGRVHSF